MNDGVFYFFLVTRVERRQASHKLIEESSQSVEIDTIRMTYLLNHLRRHILGTSTKAISYLTTIHSCLGKSKICDFYVTVMINKQILGFEIPIDYILLMKVH